MFSIQGVVVVFHNSYRYIISFSPFLDMSFQCLGSWPGENHGETYMSLLDTKLPQLGEEARPRYRCAVSPPNFTFPFFSKPASLAELNEHLVCCLKKGKVMEQQKRVLANQLMTKRVPLQHFENFDELFASYLYLRSTIYLKEQ